MELQRNGPNGPCSRRLCTILLRTFPSSWRTKRAKKSHRDGKVRKRKPSQGCFFVDFMGDSEDTHTLGTKLGHYRRPPVNLAQNLGKVLLVWEAGRRGQNVCVRARTPGATGSLPRATVPSVCRMRRRSPSLTRFFPPLFLFLRKRR